MENIHGVDVSWLHRSTTDPSVKASNPLTQPNASPTPPPQNKAETRSSTESKDRSEPKIIPQPTQQPGPNAPKASPRRPGILGRLASDKPSPAPEEPKTTKRSSWRSGWSSKFSSGPQTAHEPAASTARSPRSSNNALPKFQQSDIGRDVHEDTFEDEDETPNASFPPKSGSSFFSSALRRLSSTGPPSGPTTATEQVPACERKVLNVDQGRDRPSLKELNQSKLRRVSFSVDVEIAGNSRYPAEESTTAEEDPVAKKTKKKEKKIKERAEGESLKHPGLRKGETEREGLLHALGRDGMFDIGLADSDDEKPTPASPPEKTESKRLKETSDDKPPSLPPKPPEPAKSAEPSIPDTPPKPADTATAVDGPAQDPKEPMTNGPAENNAAPPTSGPPPTQDDETLASRSKPVHKPHDRPTTDPLRIYRRCCQLREAPVLKRISEQLGNPSNWGTDAPGVVTCLNLTKSRMQLTDIVCLGDWLAVVPVKKLLLEDANLTDEGVRIILAGLLAAKVQDTHKRKRGRSSPTRLRDNTIVRSPGIIEKLTLKNNRKLTGEAWKHISLFLHMSKSIKAVDVSMIPLCKTFQPLNPNTSGPQNDPSALLAKSIANRHAGDHLEELIFGECDLDAHQVGQITEAATKIRLKRLGLAGNRLDEQGLKHVARYIKSKVCKGIDIGGNDLSEHLPIIIDSLSEDNYIWAICFANCNLDVSSLRPLFPALVALPDFRFLDFSHNKKLFDEKPTALATLRTYLPQLPLLKRIHLIGVSMSPADLIGLAEIIPEVRNLAHLNVLENPKITEVVSANDTASQEEACAMYASIMTAVRLSKTLFCVDIDVPGEGSSEVVKALARQAFAYCLRNMERFSDDSVIGVSDAAAALPDITSADVGFLKNIAGPSDDESRIDELHEPTRHDDFLVGGRGWIKALSHCLDAADFRRVSIGGDITPSQVMDSAAGRAKAKEVSKTLLVNARNFKIRLESAIEREERGTPNEEVMRRMLFLHHALNNMIERFEQEYPDTRIKPDISSTGEPTMLSENEAIDTSDSPTGSRTSSPSRKSDPSSASEHPASTLDDFFDNDAPVTARRLSVTGRRGSEVELHNRELAIEEGKMHKMGQQFRRDVLPPSGTTDYLHGTSEADAPEPKHLMELRSKLEQFGGEEIREKYNQGGIEGILKEVGFQGAPKS